MQRGRRRNVPRTAVWAEHAISAAPRAGPELHAGRVDAEADLASPVSDYTDGATTRIVRAHQAEMAVEYAGVALQMACALTDRIPADSKVHQLPLPADIARMLKKADSLQ